MNINLRNNTGNKDKHQLVNSFVVRTKPFHLIYNEISGSNSNKPEQNYLIIGQRGAGKTTLLYRLKYEIEDNLVGRGVVPVMLSEEQYNLSDLADLWQNIADILDEHGYFPTLATQMVSLIQSPSYEEQAFSLLQGVLKKSGKKIIVFIENVDAFFKKIGKPGQQRLREVLMSSSYIRFICSATTYFEAITDYSMPFYGFFKVIELKGLNKQEAKDLLLKIGEEYGQKEKIAVVIKNSPKRLESLRRLTGGVPRTISYLFDIFLDNENGKAIKDLYRLIDDLTFLYKSELDQLSSQQQKVIDVIAKNWDAIAVKDIVERARLESKQISAILQALEKNQIVEKISTKSKNNLYRIKERFMNIWYLMRFGKLHEKESVVWLVRFYDTWCDRSELANHINNHLKNITDGKYDLTAALYMGNTFLGCENVPNDLRYNIYKATKSVWPKKSISKLQYSDSDLYTRIKDLIKENKFGEAITVLEDIDQKNAEYYLFASFIYAMSGEFVIAEENAVRYTESDPESGVGAFRVGMLNSHNLNNSEKAIEFFKKAIKLKEFRAALELGFLYYLNENIEEALVYFLIASEHKISESYLPIASIYLQQKKYELADEFCRLAIQANVTEAYLTLGTLQEIKGDQDEAIKYYNMAIEKGKFKGYVYLGNLEMEKSEPDRQRAASYYESAYSQKIPGAGVALAKVYLDLPKMEQKGIKILKKEASINESGAAHLLGHYYADKKQFEESDLYFQKAYESGRKTAALCQASEIFDQGRVDKKSKALALFQDNLDVVLNSSIPCKIEYASILLWNDEIEKAEILVREQIPLLTDFFQQKLDKETGYVIGSFTQYFTLLIAKGLINLAKEYFFQVKAIDFKQILKPVYFALTNYLKDEYPQEFLKAGDELKDTVEEVIELIENLKTRI